MSRGRPGPDCPELLRQLARELTAQGRCLQPQDLGVSARELGACLEAAANSLPARAALPAPAAEPPAPPSADSLILHADGAARGNPGPAGAGAVLLDHQGREVARFTRYLGHTTNNVAEYQGLLLGLQGALDRGVKCLRVRLDSELLVRQINGQYKVRAPHLLPLFRQAKDLLTRFASVSVDHVPRAQNAVADELSNLAIDRR